MCHEAYHFDPDLRAVANRLSGLPLARGAAQRERCMTASQMLLHRCCLEGLVWYLESGHTSLPTGELARILTKLSAVRSRLSLQAEEMLAAESTDEVPF